MKMKDFDHWFHIYIFLSWIVIIYLDVDGLNLMEIPCQILSDWAPLTASSAMEVKIE